MRKSAIIAGIVLAVLSAIVLAQDAGKFTDKRDGKVYKTVKIGSQVWMAENLNYDVPNVTTDVCYDNKADNCAKYGRLYTWSDAKAACPSGWHLPSYAEWGVLMIAVGGSTTAGTKLKSKTGWYENYGTDAYGFTALPGGSGYSDGSFGYAGNDGYWWSATEGNASGAWCRGMFYDYEFVYRVNFKTGLYSVRCVQDAGTPPPTIQYTIMFNANSGTVSPASGTTGTDGKLTSLPTPTRSGYTFDGWFTAATGGTVVTTGTTFSTNTTIYAHWTQSSGGGGGTGCTISGYKTKTIGTQTWMAENLNCDVSGSKCYGDDPANCGRYGRLYNWSTAMGGASSSSSSPSGVRGVCPVGWHLPSEAEWTTLDITVGGRETAGTKLKATSGWNDNRGKSGNGTDNYGFSALPGGLGNSGGYFYYADSNGYWWSATERYASDAWYRFMYFDNEVVFRDGYDKTSLLSVRCVEDAGTPPPSSGGGTANIEMVSVQGGTFTMGCTSEQGSDCWDEESPSHSVTVSSFSIGKYEVTQGQWTAVMGSNPSSACGSYGIGDNYPVYCVDWNQVRTFITTLNSQTGKKYRLPTEAEWEYAARGGKNSNSYKYSGSNTIGDVAWYGDNSGSTTHTVGGKQANELGIYDMSGNVLEWVRDFKGSYSSGAQTDPTGPTGGSGYVPRGGSWLDDARDCRVSSRNRAFPPGVQLSYLGFRLVLSS